MTYAFVNVSVVPMDSERVVDHQAVIVRDGQIVTIAPATSTTIPPHAIQVDGTNKYLMPGLSDMHVHFHEYKELYAALFLANGITTIRVMWGSEDVLAWRRMAEKGEKLCPTIYTSSPAIDGNSPDWPNATVVQTAAEAKQVVQEYKKLGYDFIKVYDKLSLEVYQALVGVAHEQNIPVVGHVPFSVGLNRVLNAKQASIEHLRGYIQAIQADSSPYRNIPWDRRIMRKAVEYAEENKIEDVAIQTRDAGVWNCVTHVVTQKNVPPSQQEALRNRPEMQYIPSNILARWMPHNDHRRKDLKEEDYDEIRHGDTLRMKITKALQDAGAGILLGTDTDNPFVIPGFSIHEELHNLVEAGLSPFEAISAGTRNAAKFLKADNVFGSVAVGKRADLLLIEDNPLIDVKNVTKLAGVMVHGQWLSVDDINTMLKMQLVIYSQLADTSF